MLNKRVVVKGNADDDLYGKEGIGFIWKRGNSSSDKHPFLWGTGWGQHQLCVIEKQICCLMNSLVTDV